MRLKSHVSTHQISIVLPKTHPCGQLVLSAIAWKVHPSMRPHRHNPYNFLHFTYICILSYICMCVRLKIYARKFTHSFVYRGRVLYISNGYMGVRPSLCVAYVLRCAKGKFSCAYIERLYTSRLRVYWRVYI